MPETAVPPSEPGQLLTLLLSNQKKSSQKEGLLKCEILRKKGFFLGKGINKTTHLQVRHAGVKDK